MPALTAKAIERLQPTNIRREIADGLVTGLYLVIQPSGAKSWALRYRSEGRTRKLTLGTVLLDRQGDAVPAVGAPMTLAEARKAGPAGFAGRGRRLRSRQGEEDRQGGCQKRRGSRRCSGRPVHRTLRKAAFEVVAAGRKVVPGRDRAEVGLAPGAGHQAARCHRTSRRHRRPGLSG